MLTLYYSPGSSSMATHIALNEIGAPFELKLTALHRNEHRAADYLAVNPEGKVPTLMIDGRALTEVAATLWYLARRHPAAGLLPQQGDIAAERLGPHDWTVERYSIADIHLFRLYWRFVTTLHPEPSSHPNLAAHYQRMTARPAVQRTLEAEAAIGYNLPA